MFKLKKGNVIEKLNTMDRKQIYTYGGIAIAVVVALFLLASFLGNAEDPSFDGFASRGYDLAASPFATDEAEEYLLASKYPDMQDQPSSFLYSAEEKEARQAEDEKAFEEEMDEEDEDDDPFGVSSRSGSRSGSKTSSSRSSSSARSGSRGYSSRTGSGSRQKTDINRMGNAQRAQVSGGGVNNAPFGSTRRDSDSRRNNGRESTTGKTTTPAQQNQSGRRALAQFSQGASLAAKMKDNKDLNLKRALMGNGQETNVLNEDGTLDLSKVDSSQLDTNAPQDETPDLTSLQKNVEKAGNDAKNDAKNPEAEDKPDYWEEFWHSLVDIGKRIGEHMLTNWLDDAWDDRREQNKYNSMAGSIVDGLGDLSSEKAVNYLSGKGIHTTDPEMAKKALGAWMRNEHNNSSSYWNYDRSRKDNEEK